MLRSFAALPFRSLLRVVLLVACVAAGFPAEGQLSWPSKPVHLVVANPPGAITDVVARLYADQLARAVGQPVIVENRPGADGLIGAEAAAHSASDGYSFFVASQSFVAIDPHTFKALPVDPARDFVPVAVLVDTTPIAIGVAASVPAKTLPELVALAKAQPGRLSYSVTVPILAVVGEWLGKRAGIDMVQVLYRSTAQQMQDAASGIVPIAITALNTFEPMVKAGKVRVIAVTSPSRVPGWDNVPSIMETYPDLNVGGGLVLLAPTGAPGQIIQRVNRETDAIVKGREFSQRLKEWGWANLGGARSPGDVAEYMRTERDRWGRIVRELGIQPK